MLPFKCLLNTKQKNRKTKTQKSTKNAKCNPYQIKKKKPKQKPAKIPLIGLP